MNLEKCIGEFVLHSTVYASIRKEDKLMKSSIEELKLHQKNGKDFRAFKIIETGISAEYKHEGTILSMMWHLKTLILKKS